jgi:hypothetical protein
MCFLDFNFRKRKKKKRKFSKGRCKNGEEEDPLESPFERIQNELKSPLKEVGTNYNSFRFESRNENQPELLVVADRKKGRYSPPRLLLDDEGGVNVSSRDAPADATMGWSKKKKKKKQNYSSIMDVIINNNEVTKRLKHNKNVDTLGLYKSITLSQLRVEKSDENKNGEDKSEKGKPRDKVEGKGTHFYHSPNKFNANDFETTIMSRPERLFSSLKEEDSMSLKKSRQKEKKGEEEDEKKDRKESESRSKKKKRSSKEDEDGSREHSHKNDMFENNKMTKTPLRINTPNTSPHSYNYHLPSNEEKLFSQTPAFSLDAKEKLDEAALQDMPSSKKCRRKGSDMTEKKRRRKEREGIGKDNSVDEANKLRRGGSSNREIVQNSRRVSNSPPIQLPLKK